MKSLKKKKKDMCMTAAHVFFKKHSNKSKMLLGSNLIFPHIAC